MKIIFKGTILQIAWRVGIILVVSSTVFIVVNKFPAAQAEKAFEEYNQILDAFSNNQDLKVSLTDIELKELKVRVKASVEAYYKGAQFAKSESQKKLDLVKKDVNYGPEIPLQESYYQVLRASLAPVKIFQEKSAPTYQELFDLFNYYEASSLALYNLFYYDPKLELKVYEDSHDYEVLLQAYGNARDGLQKTIDRIEKLPDFDDPTVKSFLAEIKELARQAGEISDNAVNNTSKSYDLAKDFSHRVYSLQDRILSDRKKFWGESENRKGLILNLEEIEKQSTALDNEFSNAIYRIRSLK